MKTRARFIWTLPVISGGFVLACLFYCRFWWTPHPMTLSDPDTSIVCWLFCKTLSAFWFSMTAFFASVSLLGGILMKLNRRSSRLITLIGGIPLLPTGFLNLLALYISGKNVYQ